jgi:hypothetical protein
MLIIDIYIMHVYRLPPPPLDGNMRRKGVRGGEGTVLENSRLVSFREESSRKYIE